MKIHLNSIVPTRYFLGRPDVGEEMHIPIEMGKTLIICLMAVGPVVEGRAQRDVWFEVNGEVSRTRYCDSIRLTTMLHRYEPYLLKIRTPQWRLSRERGLHLNQAQLGRQCQV